ncbi:MAG: LVIVD repeat-containing protein, partial [Thermoplasmatota archaeon]
MRVLAALLVGAFVIAGCLSTAPKAPAVAAVTGSAVGDLANVLVQDHSHADPALHTAKSANMELVGASDLAVPGGNDANTAFDVVRDYAYMARVGNVSGVTIVDIKDPAHPKVAGHLAIPNTYGSDVKASADGNYVFYSSQANTVASPAPVPLVTIPSIDPTQATNGPSNYGITVINAKDKAHPTIESIFTLGTRGFHTVHYHKIGGAEYVFGCSYKFESTATGTTTTNPAFTAVVILQLVDSPAGKILQPVSEYSVPWDPTGPLAFPHELTVAESPIDHKPYMFVSYWNAGLRVVDVSDPSKPVEVGAFTDFPAGDGNIHYSMPFP